MHSLRTPYGFPLCLLVGLSLSGIAGCGGGEKPIPRYPVSGKVTFQGKPIDAGMVTFYRQEGGGASGVIDSTGLYTIQGGVPEGQYRVYVEPPPVIMTPPPAGGPPLTVPKDTSPVPQKYRQASTSGLLFTVEPKTSGNTFDIDLK